MLPHPRSSSAGLTTRATLSLALAGAGAAVFLFVVLPQLTDTRAAERGHHMVAPAATEEDDAQAAETTSPGDELVLDPSEIPPPAASEQPKAVVAAATGADATAPAAPAQSSLVASNEFADVPPLKHVKGTGKSEKIPPGAGRAEQRKDRKEREKDAAAMGEPVPQRAPAKAATNNPNRDRLQTDKNAKGRPGSREKKGKKDKEPEKPQDG